MPATEIGVHAPSIVLTYDISKVHSLVRTAAYPITGSSTHTTSHAAIKSGAPLLMALRHLVLPLRIPHLIQDNLQPPLFSHNVPDNLAHVALKHDLAAPG